jgi:RNA polymerase sigma-70 factor, ECF subfamily
MATSELTAQVSATTFRPDDYKVIIQTKEAPNSPAISPELRYPLLASLLYSFDHRTYDQSLRVIIISGIHTQPLPDVAAKPDANFTDTNPGKNGARKKNLLPDKYAERKDLLDTLPDQSSQLIFLRDVRGFTIAEIGQLLNLGTQIVRSRLSNATQAFKRAGATDKEIGELIEADRAYMLGVTRSVLGGDSDLIHDATQNALLQAWRSRNSFRGGSRNGWLARIARNAAFDQIRREKRQRKDPNSIDDYETELLTPNNLAPDKTVYNNGLNTSLKEGIAKLSKGLREVFVLVAVQGKGYEEAAAELNIPSGTVKSRLSRARAGMRDFLREIGISKYQDAVGF